MHYVPDVVGADEGLALLQIAVVDIVKLTQQEGVIFEVHAGGDFFSDEFGVGASEPVVPRFRHEHPALASLKVGVPKSLPERINVQATSAAKLPSEDVAAVGHAVPGLVREVVVLA